MKFLSKKDFLTDLTLPLEILFFKKHPNYELHSHDFSEIVIITSGKGMHILEDEEYSISKGDIFVVQQSQYHNIKEIEKLKYIVIIFLNDLFVIDYFKKLSGFNSFFHIEPTLRNINNFDAKMELSYFELESITTIVMEIKEELEKKDEGYRTLAKNGFIRLTTKLSRLYSNTGHLQAKSLLSIERILMKLNQDYAKKWTLNDMAKYNYMSISTLTRSFKETTKTTPINYLLQLRLKKAKYLLKTQVNISITEISMRTGFNDSNYFTKQFRQMFNCTPSQMRKLKQ